MQVRDRFFSGCVISLLVAFGMYHTGSVKAQDISAPIEDEVRQRLRVNSDTSPLGETPFGESVNLYNGTLSFEETDIDLKGNGPDLKLTRSYSAADVSAPYWRQFADWKMEIPHIETTVTPNEPAFFINSPDGRCSHIASDGPSPISIPSNNPPPIQVDITAWWYGFHLVVPGEGDQDPIIPGAQNTLPLPQIKLSNGAVVQAIMTTRKHWAIGCLSSTSNGVPGEGFLAISPDGTKYWLDWLIYKRMYDYGTAPYSFQRNLAMMMVSRVEDRFGNSLSYNYDSSGNLKTITASDGRSLTLTYDSFSIGSLPNLTNPDPGFRVHSAQISASNGTSRLWNYSYDNNSASGNLSAVTLPDGSAWNFSLGSFRAVGADPADLHMIDYDPTNYTTPCTSTLHPERALTETGTISHPSGLVGTFTTKNTIRGESYVPFLCTPSSGGAYHYLYYRDVMSFTALVQKTFTGAGLPTESWNYSYSAPNQSWSSDTCASNNSCVSTVYSDVVDPEGHDIRYSFSNRFDETESQLLDTTFYQAAAGSTVAREIKTSHALSTNGPWPASLGRSLGGEDNTAMVDTLTPVSANQTLQDGDTYTWLAEAFNAYAQVTKTKRYNTIGYQQAFEEQTTYLNDPIYWVLGLPQEIDNLSTGETESVTTYSAIDTPLARSRFGQTLMNYTFNSAGQLASFTDGNNHTTSLSNYYRGIPQLISYPDQTTENLVVDDFGQISSITDQASNTTSYAYDGVGRVTQINYPANDTVAWLPKNFTYSFVTSAERGIAANHWKRTITQGNYNDVSYYDAEFHPVLDDTSITGTASSDISTAYAYDWQGQTTFASYPVSGAPALSAITSGMHSTYDALERPTQSTQDSELGALTTTMAYTASAHKVVTDPKGNVTTTFYQVFDQPNYDTPIQVTAPAGVGQNISRDLYGNPTVIYQAGTYNGQNVSLSRYLAYDSYHRLCRIFEPESNSTVYSYDGANNIAWLATGQSISGDGTVCGTGQVPTSAMTTRTYDAMNRVTAENPPTGTQSTTYQYDPTGRLTTTISGIVIQGRTYNKRGMLTGESQWFPNDNNLVRSIGYGYDAYGHLSTIVYPDGGVFGTFPDARGRATLVQGGTTLYASNISYYPDGGTAGYSLNNGITATIQRNTRQLPSNITYNQGGNQRFSEAYVYDADANLTSVTDLVNGQNNQTLGYDGLNRLTSAAAPNNWGTESLTYDPLNNIRSHVAAGLTLSLNYDGTNRLATETQGTPTGSGFASFQYDARGNQTQSNVVFTSTPHTFDAKNQMLQIPGVATYSYDEAGRRIKKVLANGQVSYFFYSQAGQLMYEYNASTSQPTDYLYLNGKLIARYLAGQNPTYLLTDRLGTPVRETDPTGAVTQTFSYRPFGQLYSGPSQQQPGYTGHVFDPESSLSYMQARYQDGGLGQFLSVDPMGPTPGNVLNFNRYAYASNNPITKVDPDGRQSTGEMIDSGAEGCGPISCAGWAVLQAAWTMTGAEPLSQVADKGWSSVSTSDKIGAVAAAVAVVPVGRIVEGTASVVRGGAEAVRVGQAGEAAVRASADIGEKSAITVGSRMRIPDGLTQNVLSEVKNVKSLSYTQQLRDFTQFSQDNGLRFDLYVRPETKLSGPLQDAIDSGFINKLAIPK